MIELGKYNSLRILEGSDYGLFLDGGELGNILLPKRYVTRAMKIGETMEVFIYNDSEDRLIATTETPRVEVGGFALLDVVGVHKNVGAFLDWGLAKDLLLPFREQGRPSVNTGDQVVVAVYVDETTNRIVASTRLNRHLKKTRPTYQRNHPVKALIYGRSELGYKAVVDNAYQGLFYYNETTDVLKPGDQLTGYVQKVLPSGKIDLRRDPSGYTRVAPLTEIILEQLEAAGGTLAFNLKSSPESIREQFDTSKKAFKQALSALYKKRLIRFTDSGIEKVPGNGANVKSN